MSAGFVFRLPIFLVSLVGESADSFSIPFFRELFSGIHRQKYGSQDKVGSAATDS